MTNITSGLMLPLTTADLLTHAIVGSVLENLDMERLVREVGAAVSQRILGNNESVDDVARELHERLLLRNESTKKVVIESIYRESEEAKHNVSVYMQAPSLNEARPLLKRVGYVSTVFMFFFDILPGSRNKVYGQISTCAHDLFEEFLRLLSLPPCTAWYVQYVVKQRQVVVADVFVGLATAKGGDGLCGVWCAEECKCVRHRGCVDAVLACGREGGVRRHSREWTRGSIR